MMSASSTSPPGELLKRWRSGDDEALHRLLPLVYEELRRIARRHLRRERSGHTLQTTALIHEAYLRLIDQQAVGVRDRCHFVALTSHLMRQILVDHARARMARKRDAGYRVTLADNVAVTEPQEIDVLAVDEALTRLAVLDPQQARIVELRYFGGLSIRETSEALAVSEATVKRDWATARAWLHRAMGKAPRT
jgi:RNA polymerase sigma factor (TIGR02999 family)